MEEPTLCPICGEVVELQEMVQSPSGSGKLFCRSCAEEIQADLDEWDQDGCDEEQVDSSDPERQGA